MSSTNANFVVFSCIIRLGPLTSTWMRMHPHTAGAAPPCCTDLHDCMLTVRMKVMEPAPEGCGKGEERRWDEGGTWDHVMGGEQHCFAVARND